MAKEKINARRKIRRTYFNMDLIAIYLLADGKDTHQHLIHNPQIETAIWQLSP